MDVDCFSTFTPCLVTSSGRTGMAMFTRFWVSTVDMSGSVPIAKVTVRSRLPSLPLFEAM
jgi:hypothetical protein